MGAKIKGFIKDDNPANADELKAAQVMKNEIAVHIMNGLSNMEIMDLTRCSYNQVQQFRLAEEARNKGGRRYGK